MFAQALLAQNPDYPPFLDRVDPDVIGAVIVLSVIFIFVTVLVTIVVGLRTFQNVSLVRMNNRLIEDLVQKGYSLAEIQQLVHGPSKWDSVKRMFSRVAGRPYPLYVRHPVPPVKQNA